MIDYTTWDVFSEVPYGGNPLAVCTGGEGLNPAQMQAIAREFNYSETTFVLPPEEDGHTARVRIFTPTMEIPFAGHPLVGTAMFLAGTRGLEDMVLEVGIGPVAVQAAGGKAGFVTSAKLTELSRPTAAEIAACLSLPPEAIATPPVRVTLGLPFVLAELAGPEALAACLPATDAFRRAAGAHPSPHDFAVYAWTRDGETIAARMFAPLDNIPEDPATGSAAATLSSWLGDGAYVIRQGEAMGRPSRIETEVTGARVSVSGAARQIMAGRILTIPEV